MDIWKTKKAMEEMYLTKIGYEDGRLVVLAHECVQWRALVLAALKLGSFYHKTS
jgi:hypothetical protein